jgi:glycosyltransferase involved in cell wall biosynthesis
MADASQGGTDVTLILPTYRRPDGLGRALKGLAGQRDPGVTWEIVVIDNDDPPGAEDVFAAAARELPVPARYVRESIRGSAHARNRGIAEATGDIIVMLDDDVRPDGDWLARLIEPILAGRSDGTGGRVLLDPAVPRPGWFDEIGIGGFLARWDLGGPERELDPGEFIVTSNCAFRSVLLRRTGGFDPELGPRGSTPLVGDDALLTRRFREVGGSVRWVPEALVVHELPSERLNRRYLLRRAYAQGRSDWILDRPTYGKRRFGGARVALSWMRIELKRRSSQGLGRQDVRFHLATDLVRTAGALREASSLLRRRWSRST